MTGSSTGPTLAKQPHSVFAMQAAQHRESVQDPAALLPPARCITFGSCNHQFISCRHADLPHVLPPPIQTAGEHLNEATGRPWGAFQVRQCVSHPD
jgi:hypothetical protein